MKKMFVTIMMVIAAVVVNANVHQVAFNLIARNEGFRASAYKCTAGVWSIGYGFTSKRLVDKRTISRAEADKILHSYVDACLRAVEQLDIRVELTDNQKAVLADMIYHFGSGTIHEAEDLLKAINSGNPNRVQTQLMRWTKQKRRDRNGRIIKDANGRILYENVAGLVTRQHRLCRLWVQR